MISEEKKSELKELIKLNKGKRNLSSKILKFLKKEIEELLEKGYAIVDIQQLLKVKLKIDVNYQTLTSWIKRNIKSKKEVPNVKKELSKEKKESVAADENDNATDDNLIPFAKLK